MRWAGAGDLGIGWESIALADLSAGLELGPLRSRRIGRRVLTVTSDGEPTKR